jgi:hypothetical protein
MLQLVLSLSNRRTRVLSTKQAAGPRGASFGMNVAAMARP